MAKALMSWGRGVQNNTAGTLRMPSVAQFAEQRITKLESQKLASMTLTVVPHSGRSGRATAADTDPTAAAAAAACGAMAFVLEPRESAASGGDDGDGDDPAAAIVEAVKRDGRAYVYTHDHPHFLLRVALKKGSTADTPPTRPPSSGVGGGSVGGANGGVASHHGVASVPRGCIALSEVAATTNHVCFGEPCVAYPHNQRARISSSTLERVFTCWPAATEQLSLLLQLITNGCSVDFLTCLVRLPSYHGRIFILNSPATGRTRYAWRLFEGWRGEPVLADLTLEVRHRYPARAAGTLTALSAGTVAASAAKQLFGMLVTVNEVFLVVVEGCELVARVVEVCTNIVEA